MSRAAVLAIAPLLWGLVAAQSPDNTTEVHPKLTTYKCTKSGGCVAQHTALVLEASQHKIYQRDHPDYNCGDSTVNATACPDEATCQQNCILQGNSDYTNNGVFTNGSDLTLVMLGANGTQENSPRIYLLNEAEDAYEMMHLTGQEFTFDVDVSKLPCGMNSALYLSEMEARGGQEGSDLAVAGAPYGTGYCDAQCYTTPFQNGVGNINGSGVCCNELDIWEANARATQFAPHTCNQTGLYLCDPASGACDKGGVCDKSGCGMNPYKMGHPDYYGLEDVVDTTRPFTVVTQFHAAAAEGGNGNGTSSESQGRPAVLTSYTRLYVQDDVVIEMPAVEVNGGGPPQTAMDDASCAASNATEYLRLGGAAEMGRSLDRGMVLIFSLWWDPSTYMAWLDQTSSNAGPCNATEGMPSVIAQTQPDTQVTFRNVRWGEMGSTFVGAANGNGTTNGTTTAAAAGGYGTSSMRRRRGAAPFLP